MPLEQNYKPLSIVDYQRSKSALMNLIKKKNSNFVVILTNIGKAMKRHLKAWEENSCLRLSRLASTCVKCNFKSTHYNDFSSSSSLACSYLKSLSCNELPGVMRLTQNMNQRSVKNNTILKKRKTIKKDEELYGWAKIKKLDIKVSDRLRDWIAAVSSTIEA